MAEVGWRGRGRRPKSMHALAPAGLCRILVALAVPQHASQPCRGHLVDAGLCLSSEALLTTWFMRPDGTAQVKLTGELDLATVAALDEVVSDCLAQRPPALDIDAAALVFCDIVGIHALLRARRAAFRACAAFHLSHPRGQLIRVIVAAQATELIASHAS
ncbi:STAS domain-containing protein [Kitasatospora herbaricolor]|uniref:STAS domain-containing protein n=1 Tax=Kitasatospora herbaricolor TaxID=68217 RepID=UPI0036DF7348